MSLKQAIDEKCEARTSFTMKEKLAKWGGYAVLLLEKGWGVFGH